MKSVNSSFSQPKVSIIVPVFNVEKYLNRCIDSILNQSFKDYELILVDDGSIDNSGSICEKYAQTDERVSVIHKQNGGVSSSRNLGIEEARGEWICFIDSDDWIEPDHIQSFFEFPLDEKTIVSQGVLLDYDKNGISKPFFAYENEIIELHDLSTISRTQLLHNGCPYSKLFNTLILRNNDIKFDENLSFHEDHCFVLKYLKYIDKVILTNSLSYHYMRQGENSLSVKRHDGDELILSSRLITQLIRDLIGELDVKGSNKKYMSSFLDIFVVRSLIDGIISSNITDFYRRKRSVKEIMKSTKSFRRPTKKSIFLNTIINLPYSISNRIVRFSEKLGFIKI